MNNCVFSTHSSLTKEHAEYSLRSLLFYQNEKTIWDNFIIYNSHSDELSNDDLLEFIKKYDINNYIKNIIIYPFDNSKPKTLNQDLINQFEFLNQSPFNQPGKTLILKSDYCLSNEFNKIFNTLWYIDYYIWSLPIYNAKSKVSQHEIDKLCELKKFEFAFDGVYYRGGTNDPITPGSYNNLTEYMPDRKKPSYDDPKFIYNEYTEGKHFDTDPSIRFISHNIQNDYNVHVFSNDTLEICKDISIKILDTNISWGGANNIFNGAFLHENVMKIKEIGAFAVHMYHNIISINRSSIRPDKRKTVLYEEY